MQSVACSPPAEIWDLIGSYLSIKTRYMLRQACKAFNKQLSDPLGYYWKKRMEQTFPTTFKELLREDMPTQISKLRPFDSLVHEGCQVSCFDIDVLTTEKKPVPEDDLDLGQLPWAPHLFVFQVGNKMCLFDCSTGQLVAKISADFEEDVHSVATVLDAKSRAVCMVHYGTGRLKKYTLIENQFLLETDFQADFVRSASTIIGDLVIGVDNTYGNQIAWHSMTDPHFKKTIPIPGEYEGFIAEDYANHAVYALEVGGAAYTVSEIDLANPTEPVQELFTRRIDMDNCGDGPTAFELIETPAGRFLQISECGAEGHDSCYVYDLTARRIVFEKRTRDLTINPRTKFYQEFVDEPSVLVIKCPGLSHSKSVPEAPVKQAEHHADSSTVHSTKKTQKVKKMSIAEPNEEHEESDPVYWSQEFEGKTVYSPIWLDDDILAFALISKEAKRGLLGMLHSDVIRIRKQSNRIVVCASPNQLYIITVPEARDMHSAIDLTAATESVGNSRKRKYEHEDEGSNKKPKLEMIDDISGSK